MPTLADVKELGNWFIGLVVAVAFGISHIRQNKKETDTGGAVEDAKQASSKRYIEMLEESRADAAQLRGINTDVREQFTASLLEFRTKLAMQDERIGQLIEDVAEWRGRAESLQAEKIDLQAGIQRGRVEDNEARRAITASYERSIASLRTEYAGLEARYHDLVNKHYGDGTATSIMGPSE